MPTPPMPVDQVDLIHCLLRRGERCAVVAERAGVSVRTVYRMVARHRSTGELVGHTLVGVSVQHPWHAWQLDTSIVGRHRGHRLGLLVKAEMLCWLGEVEPQLHRLDTGNAASNAHMIGINETLGYQITARLIQWQRHL